MFPESVPVERPRVVKQNLVPMWFSGFVTGDGSFSKGQNLVFSVKQHMRDGDLIESFKEEFKCGYVTSFKNVKTFRVSGLIQISKVIIPFFDMYPVQGQKLIQYNNWKKQVEKKKSFISM